jgi:hypothetical protein
VQRLLATLAWFCLQLRIGPLTYPRINLAVAMMVDFFVVASCRLLALFGPHAGSDFSPECRLKQTSADHAEFLGSRHRFVDFTMRLQNAPIGAPLEVSCAQLRQTRPHAVAAIAQHRHSLTNF